MNYKYLFYRKIILNKMSKKCDLTDVKIMSGNNVPKSKHKTRRKFVPNLKEVNLKSDTLATDLALKIATKVLRTINKYGNLDAYLINTSSSKLSDKGKKYKRKIKKKLIKENKIQDVKIFNKTKKERPLSKRKQKIKNKKSEQ